jgi:hypothetical protein
MLLDVATYFGLLMYFRLELSFQFCSSWPAGLQQDIASQEQSDVHLKLTLKQDVSFYILIYIYRKQAPGKHLTQEAILSKQESDYHNPFSTLQFQWVAQHTRFPDLLAAKFSFDNLLEQEQRDFPVHLCECCPYCTYKNLNS